MSLIGELKRRNVFRVGIAYAVVAWLLLQVADIVLENINAPDWVMQVFMLALALGFPLTIVLAWAFELTPTGIKRDYEVSQEQSITPKTGRKLDFAIIFGLLIAVVYFAWDNFSPAQPATQTAGRPAESAEADAKSIAVLPFVNMSSDAEQEFFSDGISEEILNVLAGIPGLKVAARTSAFAYKGTNINIADIARELKVNHILEGSVRKAGDQVRVTAQLIKADDGFHLWSDTYDRRLDNIFAIQDEIANAIAAALKVHLDTGLGDNINLTGTTSLPAYEHYLKGMALWHTRTAASLEQAFNEFNAAIALDPGFAKAHAGLALTWTVYPGYVLTDNEASVQMAIAAADRALDIDPDNTEALAAKANSMVSLMNYDQARELYERAIEINPSFATAFQWYGRLESTLGRHEQAVQKLQRAHELDPLSRIIPNNLAWVYWYAGQTDNAVNVQASAVQKMPDFPDGFSTLMSFKIFRHECEGVEDLGNRLAELLNKTTNSTSIYMDLCQTGDPARRDKAIAEISQWPTYDFANPESPTLSYEFELIEMLSSLEAYDDAATLLKKLAASGAISVDAVMFLRSGQMTGFNCHASVQAIYQQLGLPPLESACE